MFRNFKKCKIKFDWNTWCFEIITFENENVYCISKTRQVLQSNFISHFKVPEFFFSIIFFYILNKKLFVFDFLLFLYEQLSRTFRFDAPVIYCYRRIRLGIIYYEIHLLATKVTPTIVFVHKITIQAVNLSLILAKCHSNRVSISRFQAFKNLSYLYFIIKKSENHVFCLKIILESNEIYKNHVEYIEKL